jgi:hypothetical protein
MPFQIKDEDDCQWYEQESQHEGYYAEAALLKEAMSIVVMSPALGHQLVIMTD